MQNNDITLASIKKDLFVGILNTGSNNQKERALDVAREVYDWCVCHVRHDEPTVTTSVSESAVSVASSRRGRQKNTDT